MLLQDATCEQLKAELESRTKQWKGPLDPIQHPDFTELVEMVVEGHKKMVADGYEDEDLDHYVYEAVMTAVYGDGYWVWRRKQKF